MHNLTPYKPRISFGLFLLFSVCSALVVDATVNQVVKPFVINIIAFLASFLIQAYTVKYYEFNEKRRDAINKLARTLDDAIVVSLIFIIAIGVMALLGLGALVVYSVGVYSFYNLFTLIYLAILNARANNGANIK